MTRSLVACAALVASAIVCAPFACAQRGATPSVASARLWFLGDVHAGQALDRLFEERSTLARSLAAEHGFVNLEGAVVERAAPSTEARLLNDARALSVLRAAGVRFASIANNHALDNGAAGLAQSAAHVERAGIMAVGEDGVRVATVDGVRVAFVALDLSRGVPTDARARFARARAAASVRVISLHVAAPALYTPPPAELRVAVRDAVAEQATVVVAHGTHTIAPITREGRTLVAWGLGNAVFHCECSRETEGLLLRVTARADGETRASVAPLEAGLDGRALVFGGPEGASFSLLRALGVPVHAQSECAPLGL